MLLSVRCFLSVHGTILLLWRAGLGFSDSLSAEVKPRILLMGLRRSGKSSIQKVVFHKMSPSETLFLESTNKICREDVSSSSFVSFQIWDFPGQIDFFDPTFDYEMIFRGTGALIFVIDSQVRSKVLTYIQVFHSFNLSISKLLRNSIYCSVLHASLKHSLSSIWMCRYVVW